MVVVNVIRLATQLIFEPTFAVRYNATYIFIFIFVFIVIFIFIFSIIITIIYVNTA